jgi:hypothetical protein
MQHSPFFLKLRLVMFCESLLANDVLAVHSSLTDSLNDSHLPPLGYPTFMHLIHSMGRLQSV